MFGKGVMNYIRRGKLRTKQFVYKFQVEIAKGRRSLMS